VVTLSDTQELGSLLAPGVVPAATGYTPYEGDTLVPWAVQAGAGDIERFLVPNVQVPVERVAVIAPDLIVANSAFLDNIYPQLSAIAPVVAVPSAGPDWERVLRITAEAVNRADRVDAVIAEFRAQIAAAAATVLQRGEVSVALLDGYAEEIDLVGPQSQYGQLLTEMGISLAPSLHDVEGCSRIVSAEELGAVADADVLLIGSFVRSQTDALVALPTFTALAQSTAGRVARLSHSATRAGYLPDPLARTHAASGIADALAAALTGKGSTTGS
jgi:ABC-type Fe3+-hydroxamate transport system substrate-binding protein